MSGSMRFFVLTVSLIASFPVVVLSSNINIDGTCSTSSNCMQCLARGSSDVERCQQLYYYITYATGNSITKTNKVEIDRYCNGDCPIILATANYYCDTRVGVDDLLTMCPGYSVEPTGSFNVDPEPEWMSGSSCLPSSSSSSPPSQCLQCIGKNTREATRCLQLYLLASSLNTSSTYAGQFCEKNCPLTLQSTNWYCSGDIDSYSYCEDSGSGNYCGKVRLQEDFWNAHQTCSLDCSSSDCTLAYDEYGCCLARSLVGICAPPSYVGQCSLPVKASTTNIHVDSTCSISDCSACLSRENEELEKCEQLYSYLEVADGLQSNDFESVNETFCSGKCPILLLTSDYYCDNDRESFLWKLCPSYNKIPSRSVDVRASYGSGSSCRVSQSCEECVGSHSPEPTRCLQLYLLTNHPNMSNFYLEEYCKGNCPLTLATSEWYCSGQEDISQLFNVCKQTDNNSFCQVLAQDETFDGAVRDCVNDCSSTQCKEAKQIFRCCLNVNGQIPAECEVPECSILTAGAPSPNCASHLLLAIFCILVHQIINVLWW